MNIIINPCADILFHHFKFIVMYSSISRFLLVIALFFFVLAVLAARPENKPPYEWISVTGLVMLNGNQNEIYFIKEDEVMWLIAACSVQYNLVAEDNWEGEEKEYKVFNPSGRLIGYLYQETIGKNHYEFKAYE